MVTAQKLRNISIQELNVRTKQRLAILAERSGRSKLVRLGTDEELLARIDSSASANKISSASDFLESFRQAAESRFFISLEQRETVVQEFRRLFPNEVEKIIEEADAIILGRFKLLGFQDLDFGDPIDWHLEPVSGKQAPLVHWSCLDFLDGDSVGDKKIVWELNRHQYFVTLGQAYWFTGDEKYARAFVTHLHSWMDQNPPKLGINWASSLEVAFRSISWIWAFYFFKHSTTVTASTFLRAVKFLYLNALHLETYLSTYFSPNTHLTGEALGLFYLGTVFRELKEAPRWSSTGLRILTEQLPIQVRSDGVYFEQASYYHRYTTDFYLHLLILLQRNAQTVPPLIESKLTALLDHMMYITRPDGSTPIFGDDDGGRLMRFSHRPANDFRGTLTTGAAIFGRPDYKFVGGNVAEEALWLLGRDSVHSLEKLKAESPLKQSVAFETSGYYVMRDGWTRESNYLFFDCGQHGSLSSGHAHADALSYELAIAGQSVLVDPGTYTYTGSRTMRDWFRSSLAHNTLTIDEESSSVANGPFAWKTTARAQALDKITSDRFDFVKGTHDGYLRLRAPVWVSRSILFIKRDYWILRDQISSSGTHRADLWFHFDPSAEPVIEKTSDGRSIRVELDEVVLDVYVLANNGEWRSQKGWVSKCYGSKEEASVYSWSFLTTGEDEGMQFILPQAKARAVNLRKIDAKSGAAYQLDHDDFVDFILIRDDKLGRAETDRLTSNFEWTWLRFSNDNSWIPKEIVLINGQDFEMEGRQMVKLPCPTRYLVGSQMGQEFRFENEAGIIDTGTQVLTQEGDALCVESTGSHYHIGRRTV